MVRDSNIPIVGVNTGRLGFLATINKSVLLEQLNNFFDGNYNIIPRSLIKIERKDGVEIEDNTPTEKEGVMDHHEHLIVEKGDEVILKEERYWDDKR